MQKNEIEFLSILKKMRSVKAKTIHLLKWYGKGVGVSLLPAYYYAFQAEGYSSNEWLIASYLYGGSCGFARWFICPILSSVMWPFLFVSSFKNMHNAISYGVQVKDQNIAWPYKEGTPKELAYKILNSKEKRENMEKGGSENEKR